MITWLDRWWRVLRGGDCQRAGERLRQASTAFQEAVRENQRASLRHTIREVDSAPAVRTTADTLLRRMGTSR